MFTEWKETSRYLTQVWKKNKSEIHQRRISDNIITESLKWIAFQFGLIIGFEFPKDTLASSPRSIFVQSDTTIRYFLTPSRPNSFRMVLLTILEAWARVVLCYLVHWLLRNRYPSHLKKPNQEKRREKGKKSNICRAGVSWPGCTFERKESIEVTIIERLIRSM